MATVVLVGIRGYGYGNLASAYLRNWAYRDADLKARVRIESFEADKDRPVEEAAREILALAPDLIGVSCYIWNVRRVFELIAALKRASPSTPIALGGPEVASVAEKTLLVHGEADYVACGEGEETFRGLLRALFLKEGELAAVPGLARREGTTAAAPLIDLAEVPPVYDELQDFPEERALLETSRGCPFLCSFCDWGPRKMRYFSLEAVERELRALIPKVRWIHLCDADLLMDQKRGLALMELFSRLAAGTDCTLKFDTNPMFITKPVADLVARDPRRFFITLGVQTTNQDALKRIHRTFDQARADANLAYLKQVAPGVGLLACLIFGLPGDDLDGLRGTLDWAFRWSMEQIAAQLLLIPGSDLTREAQSAGLEHQAEPPYQVLKTDLMPASDIRRARELSYYTGMLNSVKACRDLLFPADFLREAAAAPGARIRRFEAWIEHLKARGVDLTFGAPVFETDAYRVEERWDAALERLSRDKLLLASVLQATRAFAETVPAAR